MATITTPTPGKNAWIRIFRITRPFFSSDLRWHAIAWLVALISPMVS